MTRRSIKEKFAVVQNISKTKTKNVYKNEEKMAKTYQLFDLAFPMDQSWNQKFELFGIQIVETE